MRILSIRFKNYRCFMDELVLFSQENDNVKNLNVLVGPNGSGKTETLFAFQWAFYKLDFNALRGKGSSPYSLNVDLYRDLKENIIQEATCSVEIQFEHEVGEKKKRYALLKEEHFTRTPKQIRSKVIKKLSEYSSQKGCKLPLEETEEEGAVTQFLNTVLPESVLKGILFDGERMQALSGTDGAAKEAIRGVINDITSIKLLEKSKQHLRDLSAVYAKYVRQTAGNDEKEFANLVTLIEKFKNRQEEIEDVLEGHQTQLGQIEARIDELALKLSQYAESEALEKERKKLEDLKSVYEKDLARYYVDFNKDLSTGYLTIADSLYEKTIEKMNAIDVPKGLVVSAVESILERENCICGRPLTDEVRKILTLLKSQLPPADVNATISEMVRQLQKRKESKNEQLKRSYDLIQDKEKDLEKVAQKIVDISTQLQGLSIVDESGKTLAELATERDELVAKKGAIQSEIANLKAERERNEKELLNLDKKIKKIKTTQTTAQIHNKNKEFVDKCIKAIEEIKKLNKMTSLTAINKKIEKIFPVVAVEDVKQGRQMRVIQYNEDHCYTMISYLKKDVEDAKQKMKLSGEYKKLKESGKSDEEIDEMIKWEKKLSSSTGQSKMTTLVFVKAILEFSQEKKAESSELFVQKSYPLMIDAPFSDIADKNLSAAAKNLPSFAQQVILMIDTDRYKLVKKYMQEHVATTHRFERVENENHSKIVKE